MLELQVWPAAPGYTALGIEPRASCILGECPIHWTTSPIDVCRCFMAIYSEFSFLGIQSEFLWLLLFISFMHYFVWDWVLSCSLRWPQTPSFPVSVFQMTNRCEPPHLASTSVPYKSHEACQHHAKRLECKWSAQFIYNNFLIWKIGGPKLRSLRAEYLKHCFP